MASVTDANELFEKGIAADEAGSFEKGAEWSRVAAELRVRWLDEGDRRGR